MKRRNFLRNGLLLSGGLLLSDYSIRNIHSRNEYTIEIYQTSRLTDTLQRFSTRTYEALVYAEDAFDKFQERFEKPKYVTVKYNYTNIPQSILNSESDDSITNRMRSLKQWKQHSSNYSTSDADFHLLLAQSNSPYGIAEFPLTPTCCTPFNNHSIVWFRFPIWRSVRQREKFQRLVLHEFGHNIGLTHQHGRNFEDGRSIMLSKDNGTFLTTNWFGEQIKTQSDTTYRFNPKITSKHFRDFS